LIGKTSDNISIYDKSKNQTLIYDMNSVKDFKIYDVPAPYLLPSAGAPIPDEAPVIIVVLEIYKSNFILHPHNITIWKIAKLQHEKNIKLYIQNEIKNDVRFNE
jgi:hypothetical protein